MDFRRIPRTLLVGAAAVLASLFASDAAAQGGNRLAAGDVATSAAPDAVTYYDAVQGVLQRNCVTCHTENPVSVGGMIAPFALTTFQDARRRSSAIAGVVSTGYMPPWGAAIQHQGTFKDERYLPPEDKQILIDWAETGAQMGDPSPATTAESPADLAIQEPTVAPDGRVWLMGLPDMVVGFDEPLLVCEQVQDWQPQVPQRVISGEIWGVDYSRHL